MDHGIQVRDGGGSDHGGGLDHGDSSGVREGQADSGRILEVELPGIS